VRPLLVRQVAVRRVRRGDAEAGEAERIGEVELVADADRVLVPLQHREGIVERQVRERTVGATAQHQFLVVDRAWRLDLPGRHHRVLLGDRGAEKADRAGVLDRHWFDHAGTKPATCRSAPAGGRRERKGRKKSESVFDTASTSPVSTS